MRQVTDDEFEDAVSDGRVLVDFFSTYCPPCRLIEPILERLEKQVKGVTFVKVNVDEDTHYASRNGVINVPALLFFEDGYETRRHIGLIPEPALRTWLGV